MSGEELSFIVTDDPSPEGVAFVEDALVAYNVEKAREYDRRPLHVFLRDALGRIIGGATGLTNWEWLYIDCFWLPEDRALLTGERTALNLLQRLSGIATATRVYVEAIDESAPVESVPGDAPPSVDRTVPPEPVKKPSRLPE